jgi:hypothetical protein
MDTVALLIPGLIGLFLVLRPEIMKRYYETHKPVFGGLYSSYPMIGIRLCGVVLIAASVVLALRFD